MRLIVCRLLITILFLLLIGTPIESAFARQQEMDLAKLFDGIDLRPSDSAIIAPPREIIRPLVRCKKLMAAGDITDAVEILGEVLADDSVEDYLISRGSQSFSSLRMRTESILGSIDNTFLEPYQVRYGIRARKLLERGVEKNDLSLLKKVSNNFFFTDSGSEAAMLLGHMELSNGQPSAAQSWFAKIIRYPSSAAKHDPEASILLATCQLLSNNRKAAENTLVALKQRMPKSTIKVMGENYPLFNRNEDAVSWLTSLIGDSPLASNRSFSKWLMFQGNPSRTGKTGTGVPLFAPRWEQATSDSLSLREVSSDYIDSLVQGNSAPFPAVQPLVVDDTIVIRGFDRMFGIDFETGLRKWAWPPQLAWNENTKPEATSAEREKLRQRMVRDSIYGRASSDGKLIFFVPHPGSSSERHDGSFSDPNTSSPEDQRTYNELVAIDAESSGMLRWRIGGPSGFDEPKLAKAYFMGEPLPLEGVLYCCCLLDNAVHLAAVDAMTGKLRWMQAIAALNNESFSGNQLRRLAGVSPSYADGKIVCMTGTGAVVALEVSTRTLLWGFEYNLPNSTKVVSDENAYNDPLADVWRDSQVTIANGMVFLTPVLSRQLICLDLDTGNGVWFEDDGFLPRYVNRASSLYLAGLNRDQLILVGSRDIRAIDSFTGKETWKLDLAVDDIPSGRGYIGDDLLFMPTSSRKVLKIDLLKGEIAESVATNRVLGNLSRVKGDVISFGVDHVASFPEYGISKKEVETLDLDELNDSQKFVKLQTLIQQGERESGLEMLIVLASKDPKPEYAALLNSCVNNFQQEFPSLSLRSLDSLQELYPDVESRKLDRIRMLAKLRTGEFRESVLLGLDQIEARFADIRNDQKFETEDDDVAKRVSARLLDPAPASYSTDAAFDSIGEVELDNRYDSIHYSGFGWERAKLQMAMEGLAEKDSDSATEAMGRVAKLVAGSLEVPEIKLQWLLERIPYALMDDATLQLIAKHYLGKQEYLKALSFANAGVDRTTDSVKFQLLKSEIFVAGKDLKSALQEIAGFDSEQLDDIDSARLDELKEKIAAGIDSISGKFRSASNWLSDGKSSTKMAKVGVALKSTVRKVNPNRYRLPFEFGPESDPSFDSLKLFICPWGGRKTEFEVRNSRGNVVRAMQIRENSESESIGYAQHVDIDIQNHVAELTMNKLMYFIDWFRIIAGEEGHLWKMPTEHVTAGRTAFSGGRETIVAEGSSITCRDTLNGRLVWKRKLRKHTNRIVSHGSQATVWSEEGMQFKTVEFGTGRLVRMVKSKRYAVTRSVGNKFVMSFPIRKGELQPEQEKAVIGAEEVENPANIAKRFGVFDASTGKLAWERVVRLKSQLIHLGREVCILDPEGKLSFIDIDTGETNSEIDVPITESQKRTVEGINIRRHSAGWILHVKSRDRYGRFKRGKATYWFESMHRDLFTGPVFLLDESRQSFLWKSPVYLERMEYLNNQPFDSPVIMFGRHIKRYHETKGESHHMQTLQLDAETGVLLGNHSVKTLESYNGHAIEWKRPTNSGPNGNSIPLTSSQTLVISTSQQEQEITFDSDTELPPLPPTHITFNAMDFFDDPVFEQPKADVVDLRIEEFRQRALDAEKVRTESRDKAAAELKKRMTGTR